MAARQFITATLNSVQTGVIGTANEAVHTAEFIGRGVLSVASAVPGVVCRILRGVSNVVASTFGPGSVGQGVTETVVKKLAPGNVGLEISLGEIAAEWMNVVQQTKPVAKNRLDIYAGMYSEDEAVKMAMTDAVVRTTFSLQILQAGLKDYKAEQIVREYIQTQQANR